MGNCGKVIAAFGLLLWAGAACAQDGLPRLPLTYTPAFEAIGRLGDDPAFKASQGCTGTLIAPDLVLTAAHCLRARPARSAVFSVDWRAGQRNPSIAIARTMRHPDYRATGTASFENDIALAVLSVPVAGVTPLALASYDARALFGETIALLGYHVGAPGGLSGAFHCPLGPGRGPLLGVSCPVRGGNSGSPLLVQSEGKWFVLGIAAARAGDTAALAVALDDWVRDAVAAHLKGG